MSVIRLTKLFTFEAAHALDGYDGKCRHIHGHSYKLAVTVCGTPRTEADDPKAGMTIDFGVLKQIVSEEIVDRLDHALIVCRTDDNSRWLDDMHRRFGNIVETDCRPTCENMLVDFAERLRRRMPEGVALHSLRLHETATSYAEWFAEDNPL